MGLRASSALRVSDCSFASLAASFAARTACSLSACSSRYRSLTARHSAGSGEPTVASQSAMAASTDWAQAAASSLVAKGAGASFYRFEAAGCQPPHARVQRYMEVVDALSIPTERRDRMLQRMR